MNKSDKMKFETPDLTAQNIEKIAALFPNVVTERRDENGTLQRAINFDMLRTVLGDEVAGDEAYEFTWVGKREAVVEVGRPIRKTLRPCIEESKNWDSTENLYIEGDNLDVLKLLQESYLGKVKMIYIDPPYNTGNDFIYRDDFTKSRDEYDDEAGITDEDGERLVRNTESNGRFHSDWCSMMYPRLALARNMLREDGVIFISIDDSEVAQLRKICDEVFGNVFFLGAFQWHRRQTADNRNFTRISVDNEYIVAYGKSILARLNGRNIDESKYKNPDNDPRGPWASIDLSGLATATQRPNLHYDIVEPNTGILYPPNPNRGWSKSKENVDKMILEGRILFPSTIEGRPREKKFLSELRNSVTGLSTWLDSETVGFTTNGTREATDILSGKYFDFPKPVNLIKLFIEQSTEPTNDDRNDIFLDFFSGSATTAHAVMQLNAEDGGNRKFIMVQLPEKTDENSEAYKAGYTTICEIGKERIRRAGEKIKSEVEAQNLQLKLDEEPKKVPDIGFRVLKLDDSNMKDVYYGAGAYRQDLLTKLESNIKEDRSDMDLLYGCLLEWGLPLSLPHAREEFDGVTLHTYNDGDLIACFADRISERVIREIAVRRPLRAVFRDSSFESSPEKINIEEIFSLIAPETRIKVI